MKRVLPILLLLFLLLQGCQQKISCPPIKPFHSEDFITVNRSFGIKRSPIFCGRKFNNGIIYEIEKNAPAIAIQYGKVIELGHRKSGTGNFLIIDHRNQRLAKYYHLGKILVEVEQLVQQGDIIAVSGNTGLTTVNSIGLSILDNQTLVNPVSIF